MIHRHCSCFVTILDRRDLHSSMVSNVGGYSRMYKLLLAIVMSAFSEDSICLRGESEFEDGAFISYWLIPRDSRKEAFVACKELLAPVLDG